jgi:hypothetical protein
MIVLIYIKKLILLNQTDRYYIILKQFVKKKKKKFTVLKSPHINKKSKESFDFSVFRINILLYVFDINMFIYLLNKIKNNILIDTNIKILLFYCNKLRLKKLNILLLNNFINCKYLKLLDIVGEINLKEKFYLNSSAVEHRTENPLVDSSNLSLDVYE